MEASTTPQGDPAPAGPGSAPSPEPTPAEAPQAPSAPAQPDAPAPGAPAPAEGDEAAQAAQEAPLATSVHIDSIRGTVILDGVGVAEVQFDFESDEGPSCAVLLEGDPIDVDVQWPPDAPTHSSVQAGLTRAAQEAAKKASGQ